MQLRAITLSKKKYRILKFDAQGDETLEFSQQIAFTDIAWKHKA
jgi:hypothetical protein